MSKLSTKAGIEAWDRLVEERVGVPLRPERLRSLLVVVPAASGDVALSTTLIRHIVQVNPDCLITFATRRSNVALIKMCPGIQDVVELPNPPSVQGGHGWKNLSRRKELLDHAGQADAVVCLCLFPEDVDLLTERGLSMLGAVWLLGGMTGGMPAQQQRVWLESGLALADASAVIGRSLGSPARARLAARGVQRLPESIAAILRTRTIKGSGLTVVARDLLGLKNMTEVMHPTHVQRLGAGSLGRDFVILSTDATSLPPPPDVVAALVSLLRGSGRTVLHNVMDPLRAAPGTVPLVCSYTEFLCLREHGIPFVGWRSGLCDIAAASQAPMCVLYPPHHEWQSDILAMFGLHSMNLAADCLEFVCRQASDLKQRDIIDHLQGKKP